MLADRARAAALAARVRALLDDVARVAGPQTWTGPAASELAVELSARRAALTRAAEDLVARATPLGDASP